MATPEITSARRWTSTDVRGACIRNNLYTRGDNEDYEAMLNSVDKLDPTPENIYQVAKDIYDHSKNQAITNIMFILERETVYTFYFIDGDCEI